MSHSGAWTVVSVVRTGIGRHVEEQSREEGAKVQLTVCTASLHTHKLLGQGSQRQVDVVLHQAFKTQGDLRCAPPTRPQPEALNPPGPACPPDRRTPPHTGPHHLHVGDGALYRPFLLSLNHLLHQRTISSIIGNHDYNTRGILHGRHIHPCQQFPLT